MTAIADLLAPASRQRLHVLANPPTVQELTEAARKAAREADGTDRIAWLCVTVALTSSGSPGEARDDLIRMLQDGKLRTTALACLRALCGDGGRTAELLDDEKAGQ
jgi:hypothetical protein